MCFIRSGTPDKAGSYEGDASRNITGQANMVGSVSNVDETIGAIRKYITGTSTFGSGTTRFNTIVDFDASREVPTADENRPKTIYRTAIVKAFSAAVNQGSVDVTQLATDVSTITNKVGTLESLDFSKFAHFADMKEYNVNGGSATTGWNIRVLNTEIENSIAGCVLGSNVVTLPAGEYWVEAVSQHYYVGRCLIAIRDSSNANVLIMGYSDFVNTGDAGSAVLSGRLSLQAQTGISLGHYCGTAKATDGLGIAHNISGQLNTFASLRIWRIA